MEKITNYIVEEGKKFSQEYNKIEELIKRFDRIAVFRHIRPDFDALGTQFGLATWLKDNYPNKEIKVFGDNHVVFTPRGLFPETDKENDEWFNKEFLAIIVDVGDVKRIADPRFQKATLKVKVDHHPETDKVFDVSVVDTEKAAASELVLNMILNFKGDYKLTREAASYFYIALAGDSGRFQFSSTTPHTFQIATLLLSTGINITSIYEKMYEKNVQDLEVTKFILNTYKVSEHGVAYYILNEADLERLGLTCERGKENVNMFSNIKGINIWCSITEDVTEPCYRISIRSRNYVINGVASEFKGGGHAQASGCQIKDLTELHLFIKALDDLVIKGN